MIYSDIINKNLILPYKKKYTIKDFNKLLCIHDWEIARFIIICSVLFYENEHICKCTNIFYHKDKLKRTMAQ